MSVDVRRLGQVLTLYADGVEVSATDLEDKQRALQARLSQEPRVHPRPVLLAAAAVLVLLTAAAAAGALWQRHPDTTVPASPQGTGSLNGLWRYHDDDGSTLFVVARDGTLVEHSTITTLLRGAGDQQHRIRDDGQRLVVESTAPQSQPCRDQPIVARSDDQLTLGPAKVNAPGCLNSSGADATPPGCPPTRGTCPQQRRGPPSR
jgi:hypothetical protein